MEVLHLPVDETTLRVGPIDGLQLINLRNSLVHWYSNNIYGEYLTWMYKGGYMYISDYDENIIRELKNFECNISKLAWAQN